MPQPPTPPDFASAAMLRVLRRGLHELGLPAPSEPPPGPGATVPLDDKRRLLTHAVQHGGLGCLVRLGEAVRHLRHEPLHHALTSAPDPLGVVQRWGRLELYIHSRHRVQVLGHGPGYLRLQHVSLHAGQSPLPVESLVVLGALLGFMRELGHAGWQARLGAVDGVEVSPSCNLAALAHAAHTGQTAEWHLSWQAGPATAHRVPTTPRGDTADPVWPAIAQAAYRQLSAQLTAPPSLNTLAQHLGTSSRHLQRQLHEAGLGYRALLAEARYRSASGWLMHSPLALAEVGFVCGYADQSHFGREFRQRSGLTPAHYRAAFGVPG